MLEFVKCKSFITSFTQSGKGSNSAISLLRFSDSENLSSHSWSEIRLNSVSSVNHFTKTIQIQRQRKIPVKILNTVMNPSTPCRKMTCF